MHEILVSKTHAESDYKYYYRMNEQLFNELLKKVTPYLNRKIQLCEILYR
jgi:hypothetical protein